MLREQDSQNNKVQTPFSIDEFVQHRFCSVCGVLGMRVCPAHNRRVVMVGVDGIVLLVTWRPQLKLDTLATYQVLRSQG